jgi:transcriptional regulator with XRE-family HTH domain
MRKNQSKQKTHPELEKPGPASATELVGKRLRELRRSRGISLRALAEKSGLSANTLSLLENGKTSPSVSTLKAIAIALETPINTFFETIDLSQPVTFSRHDRLNTVETDKWQMANLGVAEGMRPVIVRFEPLSDSGPQRLVREAKEFIYCLTGQLEYTIAGKIYTLEPGDSLFFTAKLPHSWRNPLEETSTAIIITETDRPPHVHLGQDFIY